MTGTLATIVLEAPTAGSGVSMGFTSSLGAMRFVTQVAIPEPTYARWDDDTWDDDSWSAGWDWLDITSRWRGAQWTRGRTSLQNRPETGTATLTLDNDDGALAYWNSASSISGAPWTIGPDAPVRICYLAGTFFVPGFTGRLDVAQAQAAEVDADRWITWHLTETTADLSMVDGGEQVAQGAGESVSARITRLANDAQWPFGTSLGTLTSPWNTETLQATTLADNRLAEAYLTADSGYGDVYSDRYGRLALASKRPQFYWSVGLATPKRVGLSESVSDETISGNAVHVVPWAQAPTIESSKLDIFSQAVIGRANGGSANAYVTTTLQTRVSYKRTDLLPDSDTNLAAWATAWLADYGGSVVKLGDVELNADLDIPNAAEAIMRVDHGTLCYAMRRHPWRQTGWADTRFLCMVLGYTCDAYPDGSRVALHATVQLAVLTITAE